MILNESFYLFLISDYLLTQLTKSQNFSCIEKSVKKKKEKESCFFLKDIQNHLKEKTFLTIKSELC